MAVPDSTFRPITGLRRTTIGCVVLVALAACGRPDAPAAPVTAAAPAPTVTVATQAPSARAESSGETSWTMPDVVGSNLQDAQNGIQDLTNFAIAVTTSHDSTGAGRAQVLDRNWKVCSQSVAPGTTITKDTKIDFGTVKVGEVCR